MLDGDEEGSDELSRKVGLPTRTTSNTATTKLASFIRASFCIKNSNVSGIAASLIGGDFSQKSFRPLTTILLIGHRTTSVRVALYAPLMT